MTYIRPASFFCLGLVLLAGCDGSEPESDAGATDAGATDAGSTDAGSTDAGPTDAGTGTDAGHPVDASSSDAGVADAHVGEDAGPDIEGAMALLRMYWCEPLARVACAASWDCACPDRGERPDPSTCVPAEVDACMADLESNTRPALESGALRVDEAELTRCGTQLEAGFSSCAATEFDRRTWCARRFVDAAAIDETCTAGEASCADGDGICVWGTCVAAPAPGESCVGPDLCGPGASCRSGECVALAGEEEPCGRDSDCGAPFVCAGGTCRPARAAEGAACTDTGECAGGLVCENDECVVGGGPSCVDDGGCASLAMCIREFGNLCIERLPLGARCNVSGECGTDAYCDFSTNVCTPRVGLGESCSAAPCQSELTCRYDLSTPTCLALGAHGEPCFPSPGSNDGCQEGLSCVSNVCSAPPTDGSACAENFECAEGLVCGVNPETFANECMPPAHPGEPCNGGFGPVNVCDGPYFCDRSGGSATCQPQRGSGEGCTSDLECLGDLVCLPSGPTRTCQPLPGERAACLGECAGDLTCVWTVVSGQCAPRVCPDVPVP